MAIKVSVGAPSSRVNVVSPSKNRVSINTRGSPTIGGGGTDRLTQLLDVDASDVDNNETVVYDEVSGKFVIKELPVINGGTF